MIVLLLLLLLLTPAWSLAQDAEEPSLAEVARRERERRASMGQPAQIITNINLRDVKGKVSNGTAPSSVGTEGENGEGESQKSENGKRDLAEWESLFSEATRRLESSINRDRVLAQRMTELNSGVIRVNPDETGKSLEQEWSRQARETKQMFESNRKGIEAARKSLQNLKRKARLEGLPPGTIRGLAR